MNYKNEIARRDKKIEDLKKEIKAREEEISAMHELLDCAAANLVLTVKNADVPLTLPKKDVSDALGKFHFRAKDDGNGNYILEIVEE